MTTPRTLLCCGVVALMLVVAVVATPDENKPTEKRKRQIFREQVLPHSGGKIPGDAFRADRLALNRLNKDGISIPDGVLLDARRHDKHPHVGHNSDLEASVIKVVLTPDGRYVPPEGKYHDDALQTIDSTYIIRPPIDFYNQGTYGHEYRRPKMHFVREPVPAKLEIPADVGAPTPTPTPTVLATFKPYDFGFVPPSNFVYQSHDSFYPEFFHPFYAAQNFPPFEAFFRDFHQERLARQTDRNRIKFPTDGASDRSQSLHQKSRDFPAVFKASPVDTSDVCRGVARGGEKMFADVQKNCQMFHVCRKDGRKDSFVCPKGMLFNDASARCDYWQNVRCR